MTEAPNLGSLDIFRFQEILGVTPESTFRLCSLVHFFGDHFFKMMCNSYQLKTSLLWLACKDLLFLNLRGCLNSAHLFLSSRMLSNEILIRILT